MTRPNGNGQTAANNLPAKRLTKHAADSIASPSLSKEVEAEIVALALARHVVHKDADGGFIVCKYGLSKYCSDFAELQAFALKLGVHHE